ncbi:MAG: Ppx/GppA family phosphatase [Alphaproteobacteria bacterium]|nr:Ppx/GppA family phosphatase [Alphaproteobacteria bacterium]
MTADPGSAGPPRTNGRTNHCKTARPRREGQKTGASATGGQNQGPGIYAALDLGTNNCRLLVARPTAAGFRVIDGFSRIVRLGEGLSKSGRLDEAAMDRTIEALKQCKSRLDGHKVRSMRLITTEACRSASNSHAFLDRVRRQVGLDLEVVDRKTEAELAVTGCADLVDAEAEGAILFDIGGGSSELVWLDLRGGRPKSRGRMATAIRSWRSLPVGVVSIAEKFGGTEVSPELFEDMVDFVSGHLSKFRGREKLSRAVADNRTHFLGTSGTVTTLAGLHLGLQRYDRSRVDGLWMKSEHMVATIRVLLAMGYERRVANACIGRERADLVIPGCAIFEAIRREWPCKDVRVADRGLREGILITLMARDRVWSRRRWRARTRAG